MKIYYLRPHRYLAVLCMLMVIGCAVKQPAPPEETLQSALPESTVVAEKWSADQDTGKVDDGWLKSFGDKRLDALAAEVLANNLNLQAAAAQVDVAAGLGVQAGAALKPTVGLSAATSTTDAGLPVGLESSNAFLSASWEVDVWGRVRAGASAAQAGFEASQADYEFARQSLVAQTAKAWFLSIQIAGQQALAQEAVDIFSEIVKLVEIRQRVGKAQPQDLPLARANLSGAKNTLRQINSSYQDIMRSIEVLLGRYPSGKLVGNTEFNAELHPIPVGLPSEILERRPDLIAAERRVAATFFGSQQARAARLPKISLTAGAGAVDSGLATLAGVSNPVVSLGANLFAPLYSGGALKAGVDIADAQQRAVLALYGQAVLQAFKDVETALTNEQLFKEREGYLQAAVDEGGDAYRITKAQYKAGRVDLLALLQTQISLLSARSALIAIRNERLSERVNLHLALGGSFETTADSTAK